MNDTKLINKNSSNNLYFYQNYMLSGLAAIISKTPFMPIERLRNLMRLRFSYKEYIIKSYGVIKSYGIDYFFRGNLFNILRYSHVQALNFAFKDKIKQQFIIKKLTLFLKC